ncbi:MAG TPA: hemerythrin family protein [Peptococcaceae bacterium]|nr:hemerythrin family protein [Peptococcaceae bacterium]
MLEWKEEYAIGVPLIDEQHQKLFEIGNRLYELLENYILDDKYDKIVAIIQELREYTKYHFASEEQYMLQIKYPKYFSQKVEHDDFIAKIEEVELKEIDENQDQYIRDLLVFVFNWILEHIIKKDKLITSSS